MRFLLTASLLLGASPPLLKANDPPLTQADSATSWPLYLPPRCTEQQCKEIRRGMSLKDVTAILGCPPGDYTSGRGMYISFIDPFPADAVQRYYRIYWCGQHGAIGLTLDEHRKVKSADWFPALDPPE